MSDSPQVGRAGPGQESPMMVTRTRSGDNMVRPQPVTEQSLMESVAGKKLHFIQLYDLYHLILYTNIFDVDTIYVSHRDFKYLSKIFCCFELFSILKAFPHHFLGEINDHCIINIGVAGNSWHNHSHQH